MAGGLCRFTSRGIAWNGLPESLECYHSDMHSSPVKISIALLFGILAPNLVLFAAGDMPEWRYTVRPGDTLIGFSKRYLSEPAGWPELQRLNALTNPHYLRPGQTLRVPLSLLKQKPVPAEVVAVSGHVQVIQPGMLPRELTMSEKLASGAVIEAAAHSSATLRLADGSVLVLQPGSTMTLDTMSLYEGGGMVDSSMRLQQGRVEITANPKHESGHRMQVITPSAVAAVRGTRFRVAADNTVSKEETLDGKVALNAASQEVEVSAGYGSLAELGKPPGQPVALLPAPDLHTLPVRIDRLPISLDFSPQARASGWVVQVAPDVSFNRILLESRLDAPHLAIADLPDGKYSLRIRAVDSSGLEGIDALHDFELDARPFPPLLLAPANGAVVRTSSPELEWSKAEGAGAYEVELASDSEFKAKVISLKVDDVRMKVAQELAPGEYFLRVASVSGEETGPFSVVHHFRYKSLPGVPDLSQPVLDFDRHFMRVNLPPPPEGLRYEAELAADNARKQVLWRGQSMDGQLQMPRPLSGKRYLSVRLLEAEGMVGPYATQVIDVPRQSHWEALMFLLPLLAI